MGRPAAWSLSSCALARGSLGPGGKGGTVDESGVAGGSRFGALVVALLVLTLGVGLTSPASEPAAAPDTHKAFVTAPAEVVSATAVSSTAKVVPAALRSVWSLVAIELVALVAALTTVVGFSRWIGACWLRAPPRVNG